MMSPKMTTTSSTKQGVTPPFLNARLVQTRLVNEQISSAPLQPTTEPKPVQLKTETKSEFLVALDNPETPSGLLIEIQYTVTLKLDATDHVVADYKGKHAGEFKIISRAGFEEWTKVPHTTLVPYFAMLHNVALRHAQRALLEMGLGAIVLPVLTEFALPASSNEAKE